MNLHFGHSLLADLLARQRQESVSNGFYHERYCIITKNINEPGLFDCTEQRCCSIMVYPPLHAVHMVNSIHRGTQDPVLILKPRPFAGHVHNPLRAEGAACRL